MDDRDILHIAEGLHPLERKVLPLFVGEIGLSEAALLEKDPSLQPSHLSTALEWLLKKQILCVTGETTYETVSLTPIGKTYAQNLHPVLRMATDMAQKGEVTIRSLQQRTDMDAEEISNAIGCLKETGTATVRTGGILALVAPDRLALYERLQETIERLSEREWRVTDLSPEDRAIITAHHRKRGKSKGIFHVTAHFKRQYGKTAFFEPLYQKMLERMGDEEIGAVTPTLLKEGRWRGRPFRKYHIQSLPPRIGGGRKHPYKHFLDEVKQQFVSMGFVEMCGPPVESEFWNMDALYMPQFHPAREIHDVYSIDGRASDLPADTVSAVVKAHENGGNTGSLGWRYPFDVDRTRRLVLRSQGTAVSARTLSHHPIIPGKYFSIARCFRYDQVDATHAPDFFQVEGIVLTEEANLRTLLGLLTLFAKEIAGVDGQRCKFLPAYFPFTEPSIEMHIQHPNIGWMELGGAGLLRPEVTQPLGVDVPVIAWGLGLDRMAMVALDICDIRDLFSADLGLIRTKRIKPS